MWEGRAEGGGEGVDGIGVKVKIWEEEGKGGGG